MNVNYNTDLSLWHDSRQYYKENPNKQITVTDDGHIFVNGDGCVARFTNSNHAKQTLIGAGYVEIRNGHFLP